jgi:hypothetical protein
MFLGRVGETINTLWWFILDLMIEAKKRAWIDLLLEHLQPQNSKQLLYFRIKYSLMITVPTDKRRKSAYKDSKTIYVFTLDE